MCDTGSGTDRGLLAVLKTIVQDARPLSIRLVLARLQLRPLLRHVLAERLVELRVAVHVLVAHDAVLAHVAHQLRDLGLAEWLGRRVDRPRDAVEALLPDAVERLDAEFVAKGTTALLRLLDVGLRLVPRRGPPATAAGQTSARRRQCTCRST